MGPSLLGAGHHGPPAGTGLISSHSPGLRPGHLRSIRTPSRAIEIESDASPKQRQAVSRLTILHYDAPRGAWSEGSEPVRSSRRYVAPASCVEQDHSRQRTEVIGTGRPKVLPIARGEDHVEGLAS